MKHQVAVGLFGALAGFGWMRLVADRVYERSMQRYNEGKRSDPPREIPLLHSRGRTGSLLLDGLIENIGVVGSIAAGLFTLAASAWGLLFMIAREKRQWHYSTFGAAHWATRVMTDGLPSRARGFWDGHSGVILTCIIFLAALGVAAGYPGGLRQFATRAARLVWGFRDDLSLPTRWWHRLSTILFILGALVFYGVCVWFVSWRMALALTGIAALIILNIYYRLVVYVLYGSRRHAHRI